MGVSLGNAVACGGGKMVGAVRPRGPGLIGRTGSKYWVSGVLASTGARLSIDELGSVFGNGVSPYVGMVVLWSDEAGVWPDEMVGEGDGRLCDLRGVAVGDGRVKNLFNLSPSVSFCS